MTTPTLTEFVLKATEALSKYEHLRFMGMSHEMAIRESGMYDVIVRPSDQRARWEDHRMKAAGGDGA